MKKKAIFFFLCLALLSGPCYTIAEAAEVWASDILTSYTVALAQGSSPGELVVKYDVRCNAAATVGVESIVIYRSTGAYVTTITGTTSNGLLKDEAYRCSGTYTYQGTSGTYYYAIVTVSADSGTIHDSRDITTSTVKAP